MRYANQLKLCDRIVDGSCVRNAAQIDRMRFGQRAMRPVTFSHAPQLGIHGAYALC